MRFNLSLALFLCCLAVPVITQGADDTELQTLKSLTETELSTTPKNVTTETASRYTQSRAAAASSLHIVTAEEIRQYGYRNLGEILRSLPGVYLNNDRGYNYLGVRGFNRPGDYNSRVLVLIDGERMNTNVYESTGFGENSLVDIDLIERVEFSPGPGSAMYGNSAFLGVINIITKGGHQLNGFQLSGEYGSFDTYKIRGSFGKRLENGDEILLSASAYDREGYKSLYYPEYDTPSQNFGRVVKQDDERVQSAFAKWKHGPFTWQGAVNFRNKGLPAAPYASLFNDPANKLLDDNIYTVLNYDDTIAQNWTLHAGLSFHRHVYTGHYAYWLPQGRSVNLDRGSGEWWRGEFRVLNTSFDAHHIMFGGEVQYNSLQNQRNVYFDGSYPFTAPYQSLRYGFFLQDEWAITDNLTFLAGARYDYNPLGGSSANPRLGLIWQAFDTTTLKLLYGSAFRAPNAMETLFSLGDYYKANPNLKPETIDTTELVVDHFFTPSTRFSGSFYYYEISNRITQVADDNGALFFTNLGTAHGLGAELELEQRFQNGIRGTLSYSLQKSADKSGQRLFNSPAHLLKLHVSAPVWENWRVNLETLYTSARRAKIGYVDDYFLANLSVTGDIFSNSQLSFSLYNLFNSRYANPVGGDFLQNAIPQDGRGFRLKLTIGF